MERPVCKICQRWVSEWQEHTGKVVVVNRGTNHENHFHISCAMEKNLTISQLEEWHKREAA